ncbi:MAG: hypothetical protein ACM33U_11175 [Solirubrobacterales bacterium]|nr:hypothetical protein [Solirubrobacterales bacterium]
MARLTVPNQLEERVYGSSPSFARAADQLWFQRKIGRMIGVR